MMGARIIAPLDNLCSSFLTGIDYFQTHGAVYVLDVVEAFVALSRGFQLPPLVILADIRVLLDSSPLGRRFAFNFQG
jgi:GTP:adenosylcobinamide-phosphate guanylyltransferase